MIIDEVEAFTRKSQAIFRLFSLMLGKPRIRLNNLKNSLRFLCLGLSPIIDSINLHYFIRSRKKYQQLASPNNLVLALSKYDLLLRKTFAPTVEQIITFKSVSTAKKCKNENGRFSLPASVNFYIMVT